MNFHLRQIEKIIYEQGRLRSKKKDDRVISFLSALGITSGVYVKSHLRKVYTAGSEGLVMPDDFIAEQIADNYFPNKKSYKYEKHNLLELYYDVLMADVYDDSHAVIGLVQDNQWTFNKIKPDAKHEIIKIYNQHRKRVM